MNNLLKKLSFFLFGCFLLNSYYIHSQELINCDFGSGNSIIETDDNQLVMCTNDGYFLTKTNQSGGVIWSKTAFDIGFSNGACVKETSDNGLIVTGSKEVSPINHDVYLVKTDSDGNLLWSQTYGSTENEFGWSVQQTADGGYIVCGQVAYMASSDIYLIKTDADGNPEWTNYYGGTTSEIGYSVVQASDGGFVVAGSIYESSATYEDVYLLKTDADGNTVWTKTYGGSNSDIAYSIANTFDNGFIVCGYTNSFGAGASDAYLIRTDNAGDEIWSNTYGTTGYENGKSVVENLDHGYTFIGSQQLVKVNALGNAIWEYDILPGADGYSLIMASNSDLIAIGSNNSAPDTCLYFIHVDSTGYYDSLDCSANFIFSQGGDSFTFDFNSISAPGYDHIQYSFGDGTYESEIANVSHTFPGSGTYNVCLNVWTNDSLCNDTYCQTITVIDTVSECNAGFVYSLGADSQTLNFTSTSTGAYDYIQYSFGDGFVISDVENPSHYFSTPGDYEVCLFVWTDDLTCNDTICQTITVLPTDTTECIAAFTYSIQSDGHTVDFVSSSSGAYEHIQYIFGDMGYVNDEENPTHYYENEGTYEVCLYVWNVTEYCSDTLCQTITITDTATTTCNALFTSDTLGEYYYVQFTDLSEGDVIEWVWDFGDGSASTMQNPLHIFSTSGVFSVTLTINTSDGCSSTYSDSVIVYIAPELFVLEGTITGGGAPVEDAIVVLFSEDLGYAAVDYTYSNASGVYHFDEVVAGDYIIYAIPNPSAYPDYISTYYVNATFWADAYQMSVLANTYSVDIQLAEFSDIDPGSGLIAGIINLGEGASYESDIYYMDWWAGKGEKSLLGEFASNISIVLSDASDNIVGFDLSDSNGEFSFANLPNGTYKIHAEKAGLLMTDLEVNLSDADNIVDDIVLTITETEILSGIDLYDAPDNSFSLFPNPVSDILNISVDSRDEVSQISIVDIGGRLIFSQNCSGNHAIIDMSELQNGFYFVNLSFTNGKVFSTRIIKQ